MVDVPNLEIKPSPVVTSEAPTQHISGADITGPHQMLDHALHRLGEGMDDIAVPFAEKAGTYGSW